MARHFLVTSPGYTATRWLAWALDQHPQVHCTHAASARALRRPYLDQELRDQVRQKYEDRDHDPLDSYLRALPGQALAATGNVHRFNLTALRRHQQRWPGSLRPVVLNLLRHPVPWVASGAAQMAAMAQAHVHDVAQRLRLHFQAQRALYLHLGAPARPSVQEQAFAWMCHRLLLLARDVTLPQEEHATMEALTTQPAALAHHASRLTGLALQAQDPWVERALRQGPIHRHAPPGPRSPQERWQSWAPWQRRAFRHWAQEGHLFHHYRRFGYRAPWSPTRHPAPPVRLAQAERSYQKRTWPVKTRALPWETTLEPALRQTQRALREHLRQQGLGEWLDGAPRLGLSRGASGRVAPLLDSSDWIAHDPARWISLFYQPRRQDRSPGLSLYSPEQRRRWVINLKGAGQRDPLDNFMERSQRCPDYTALQPSRPHRPLDLLFGHPPQEWSSHTLVGGALLWPSLMEARYALGWHRLLLALDGAPAHTCLPLRLHLLQTLPCPHSQEPRPAWDYFTHPDIMAPPQLAQLWRGALGLPRLGSSPERLPPLARRLLGTAWLLPRGPVLYEHATQGKLRIGHLWEMVHEEDDPQALWSALVEVYLSHGHPMPRRPDWTGGTRSVDQRFKYLERISHLNQEAARDILQRVGQRVGRSLGALHGAGGHGLGRRLLAGDGRLDPLGLPRRIGAPGGGVCAPRNMTVCGELVDTSHLFNPWAEGSARLEAAWARLGPGRGGAASPSQRDRLQRADLALARQSLTQLAALLLGQPGLIPAQDQEIEALRRQRKRLEDRLAHQPDPATREQLEACEAQLRALRGAHPGYGDNLALRALKSSHRAWFQRSLRFVWEEKA